MRLDSVLMLAVACIVFFYAVRHDILSRVIFPYIEIGGVLFTTLFNVILGTILIAVIFVVLKHYIK